MPGALRVGYQGAMSSVSALLRAASRLARAGRAGALAPSVDTEGGAEGLPARVTLLAGGADARVAADPLLAGWFARVVGALSGRDTLELATPGRLGRSAAWPLLGADRERLDTETLDPEGRDAQGLDARVLEGAVPAGSAWIVAFHPDRFFDQAAARLDARGDERGAEWAARLRSPAGNIARLGALVHAIAVSLDLPHADNPHGVLRLRLTCPDAGAARQTTLLLHGWRIRRGLGDGADAAVFRASDLVRADAQAELTLPGEIQVLTTLFGGRR